MTSEQYCADTWARWTAVSSQIKNKTSLVNKYVGCTYLQNDSNGLIIGFNHDLRLGVF